MGQEKRILRDVFPGFPEESRRGEKRMTMYYESVFKALQENNIRYAVAGGVVRFTADLDLTVDLEEENLSRFVYAMNEVGYHPRYPLNAADFLDPKKRDEWKSKKGMVAFSFIDQAQPMSLVDVFIEEHIPFREIARDLFRVTARGDRDLGRLHPTPETAQTDCGQAAGPRRHRGFGEH